MSDQTMAVICLYVCLCVGGFLKCKRVLNDHIHFYFFKGYYYPVPIILGVWVNEKI